MDPANKFHPQTVQQACRVLAPQVASLVDTVQTIDAGLRGDRIVFEATMLPNYLAGSYHPADLLRDFNIQPLGSRTSLRTLTTPKNSTADVPSKTLILSASLASLADLSDEVAAGVSAPRQTTHGERLRQFDTIGLASESQVVRLPNDSDEERIWPDAWEVVLHPDPDANEIVSLRNSTFRKFVDLVESLDGEVLSDWTQRVDAMTFVPVRLDTEVVSELAAFNPLRSVTPMPRLGRADPGILRRYEAAAPLAAPVDDEHPERPTILIFDGGVDLPSPYFDDYVTQVDIADRPVDPDDQRHGTAITTAVLYGDVEPGAQLPSPSVNVTHYRASPSNGDPTEMFELLERITDVINDLPPGQVVNLSIGPRVATVDDTVHLWTIKLDQLAIERDCLFIVAAGNNGNDDAALGYNRIQPPADMVNGISVGACARRYQHGVAVERASYSAVGPGRPGARIQPLGVAFGGSHAEWFLRMDGQGKFTWDFGTSYAAPLVTHGIGEVMADMGPERSSTLLRALAIHCAIPVGHHQDTGWGVLSTDYDEVLDYPRNEVTVVSELDVTRDGLHTLPIAFPSITIPGNVGFKCTVVVQAPTEPREAIDYTMVGVDVTLRPHSGRKRFTDPNDDRKTRVVDIINDPATYRALLTADWRESTHPLSRASGPAGALELSRREVGGKWETSLRIEDTMRATSLHLPRVDLDLISRSGGTITHGRDTVHVAVVTTLVARADIDLYGAVTTEFDRLDVIPARLRATT